MANVDLLNFLPGTVNSNGTAVALRFRKCGRACKAPNKQEKSGCRKENIDYSHFNIIIDLPLSNAQNPFSSAGDTR